MSAIPWTVIDPDTLERMVAVGLCRRHKQARRVKPSQGDGGLDVLVPLPGQTQLHVDNYQVKKFADGLGASRQRQIKKSLKRAIDTHNAAGFGYVIYKWYLTLPMDLTREQEKWLFDLASELNCPFPVEVFGLTQIEELLLEAPNIREYYIGHGLERIREAMAQMSNLTDLKSLAADALAIAPTDVTNSLAELHRNLNSADPHFDYDYEVTTDVPSLTATPGRIASIVGRNSPGAPYVTWHISTKYDAALEDRSIPGGYNVYPDRMSPEQRDAWDHWHNYGTPVELNGDVISDFNIDLPGGLGGPLPGLSEHILRLGPAAGKFDGESAGRSLWVIEDPDGVPVAERLFTFRLRGRGMAGGEYRHGVDADGYLTVDLYSMLTGPEGGSMQIRLDVLGEKWVGEPVQRVLPALRFAAAWTHGNVLRAKDEFGIKVASEALPLNGTSPLPPTLVSAVEDLVRISAATKTHIALPPNMSGLSEHRGVGLRMIADAVSGLDPLVGIGELVVWHEDDPAAYADLAARAEAGTLVVPWSTPFPLLGEDFHFALSLEVSGEIVLEADEPSADQPERRKAVRVVPTKSTRGRLHWDPDQAAALNAQ
jgi:hypothetical protein